VKLGMPRYMDVAGFFITLNYSTVQCRLGRFILPYIWKPFLYMKLKVVLFLFLHL